LRIRGIRALQRCTDERGPLTDEFDRKTALQDANLAMTSAPAPATGQVLTISPSAIAAAGILLALLFVFQLGSISALAFLACGLVLVVLRPMAILDETSRYGWIYLLPVWCVLTMFWSTYPELSLRYGVQLGLTVVFAVTMAARLPPAVLVRLIWLSFAAAAVASVLFGKVRADGAGWLGIYGSKNAFAMLMSIFVLASFAFVLDRRAGWLWRVAGLVGTAVGFMLVVLAQSTGALGASVLAMASGMAISQMRRFSPFQQVVLAVFGVLALVFVILVFTAARDQIESFVLTTTGKDATLTGRTELWIIALEEWSKHPILGQGYQAFWVVGNPMAEQLWDDFGITTKIGFHFHNTWLSNVVEIGVVGVALQMAVFGAAFFLSLRWAIWNPCAESLFFAMFILRQASLSLLEVVAFTQFDMASLLAVCAAVYGLRVRAALQVQRRQSATTALIPRAAGAAPQETGTASQRA
jgi:exopolysaccharide production protein ExoQ